MDWWWRRSGTALTARCCDSVQTASGWCTSTAAKNLAGYGRPTFCPSPIHQRLRQAQHQRLRAPRGGSIITAVKGREGVGCPSALPIRGSIPRPPRPEQDVKLLSLQARSPSLPPCPPHVASLPAHVCTHVLTACVLCCRSSAAAIAIAIAAISAVRAATAHRQSAAVAVAIAIAATATAVATAAPSGAALFITLFYYCVAF